jgi:hypothetical protein
LHRPGDHEGLAQLLVNAISDVHWQKRQAERNFAAVRAYSRTLLDQTRRSFWQQFAQAALEQLNGDYLESAYADRQPK